MAISEDGAKTVLGFRFVHDKLYQWVRVAASQEPSPWEAAFDSQSVETATMICTDFCFDAGKQIHGRKRFITVDLLGLVLRVLVASASVPEGAGAKLNVHILVGLSDER